MRRLTVARAWDRFPGASVPASKGLHGGDVLAWTGSRLGRWVGLTALCLVAPSTAVSAPSIDLVPPVSILAGRSVLLAVTGSSPEHRRLTYSATSGFPDVEVKVHAGNPWLKLTVKEYGEMTFQLLADLAPVTTAAVVGLVNKRFYDNLTLHEVVPGVLIKGGDPKGDGTGGPGFVLEDEFAREALFTTGGLLAMASKDRDAGGSQFFVTLAPHREFDFNHTIVGRLVRGMAVARAISQAPTVRQSVVQNGQPALVVTSRPVKPIIISRAEIVDDSTDAVITLSARPDAIGSTIEITVEDGAGGVASRVFDVTATPDTYDDPPILAPVSDQTVYYNNPARFELSAIDFQSGPVEFTGGIFGSSIPARIDVSGNVVTVTPDEGVTGSIPVILAVRRAGATSRGDSASPFDTQVVTVRVTPPIRGDMSADGKVNVKDASIMMRIAIGILATTPARIAVGDMNGDGRLDVKDALILLKRAVGL